MRCGICSIRACGVVAAASVLNYSYITSFDTKEDALEVVGGKGRSLAKLATSGNVEALQQPASLLLSLLFSRRRSAEAGQGRSLEA